MPRETRCQESLLLAEAIHGVSAEILNLQISWQAQYLVRLELWVETPPKKLKSRILFKIKQNQKNQIKKSN